MFSAPPAGDGSAEIADLIVRVGREHSWMHVEKLQRFDGADGFTKDQGEG
jgi:isocitrate dehydrogenase